MFNYELYTLEEFLEDNWFREWVFNPTPTTESFWNEWIRHHPEKQLLTDQARAMLRALEMPHQSISKTEIAEAVDAAFAKIHQKPGQAVYTLPAWSFRWVAAAILFLTGLGGYVLFYAHTQQTVEPLIATMSVPSGELMKWTNHTQKPERITLSDGSKVLLSPSSSLSYPSEFSVHERKIYLKGNAFFEITRDPAKPFFVITNKLITKVLGTSFWVMVNPDSIVSRVVVRTGKVSVYKTEDLGKTNKKPGGILLLPNQQAVFLDETNQLTKSIVAEPIQIHKPVRNQQMQYSEAPASQIFGDLAQAYGIQIVYDEEILKDCHITATLGNEPLFETLKLLCNSIHASYEVMDTQIVIYSKGCNEVK